MMERARRLEALGVQLKNGTSTCGSVRRTRRPKNQATMIATPVALSSDGERAAIALQLRHAGVADPAEPSQQVLDPSACVGVVANTSTPAAAINTRPRIDTDTQPP